MVIGPGRVNLRRRRVWARAISASNPWTLCLRRSGPVTVGLLGLLSLLPGQDMVRTGFPGPLEHFAAYAGPGAIAMAGYGLNRGAVRVIGCLWVYAGILEYLQQ